MVAIYRLIFLKTKHRIANIKSTYMSKNDLH